MAGYKEVKELIDTHMEYVREDLGEIKDRLTTINGHLDDHSKRITITETLQKERNKPNKKTLGGYSAGVVGLVVALWKAFSG